VSLSVERLKAVLAYDTETGLFRWLIAISGRVKVGAVAGTTLGNGKVQITIDGKHYYAHRLAVLFMTGAWPPKLVDHKDRTPGNAWVNLRDATKAQNGWNRKTNKNNKSGCPGVYREAATGDFKATIRVDGKRLHLGRFNSFEKAKEARLKAVSEHHGEFGVC
jgi:hypothetical protein